MTRTTADDGETLTQDGLPREPLYGLIELMFFAYRDFVEDADRVLAEDGFGRAHHRVLYFAARRPGLTVAELLDILRITKQSLNRVLKDLLDRGYVESRLGETDRRQRLLHPTERGEALVRQIAALQSARFARAFGRLGPQAQKSAAAFLDAMTSAAWSDPLHPLERAGVLERQFEMPTAIDRRGDADIATMFGVDP